MKVNFLLLVSVVLGSLFMSCKADKLKNATEILRTAEDNAIMSSEFSSLYETSQNTANSEQGAAIAFEGKGISERSFKSNLFLPECAELIVDTAQSRITIDYGNINCLCNDGLYRKGKVMLQFNSDFREVGSSINLSLDNYFVSDVEFQGTKTITNMGEENGIQNFAYEVRNAKAITENGDITWETDATISKIEGVDTPNNPFDDIYLTEATATGVNKRGKNFTATTPTVLKKRMELNAACLRHYVSGVIRLVDEDDNFLEVDYNHLDNEACDRYARVNINDDFERVITLR